MKVSEMCQTQYDWVEKMGWHNKTVLENLALIASEVGEAVNECRGNSPSENFASELADIVLRVADLSVQHKIDLEDAIIKKIEANKSRGTKGRVF
jgi:NTP pyrophosphatase (non-canonical NTP hydrolase)